MKKLSLLLLLFPAMVSLLNAQVLVGTDPTPKNALLEEYTGIHCTYCPDGHAIAQSILDNNPGRACVIAIHQGSFASPSAGEPDYRTAFGDALAGQTGLTGYPSGTVNRHVFTGSTTALNRGSWSASCDQIMQEMSPVNIGIASSYNAASRELSIQVELYYTADAPASSNFINVALIQDSVYGPQTGGGAGSNYRHMHMLRHLITGQWGDEVSTTTAGSLVSRTYSYTVPEAYNNVPAVVEHMKVVVFVAEDHQEVYTADEVDAIGGTNLYIGNITSAEPYIQRGYQGFERTFTVEANSNIDGTEPFVFELINENSPADWQASYIIDGVEYTGSSTIDLTKGTAKPVTIKVIPGPSAGFPGYLLKMKSLNNPSAPEKMYRVMLVAGVTDLLVNGTGGPESVNNQGVYLDGFMASGNDAYAVVNANVMRDMINASAYQDVFTCWLNIAWTFPALSDSQAEAVMDFMDAGHNIFIAGQDIGWDIMSGQSGSNGTAITQQFYTDYLKAAFVGDGSSANNKLTAVATDPIFGGIAQSSIVDVYAGNMYPEEINALDGADLIFDYNTTAKHAALRFESENYRSVYFGIGLEMLSNAEVRNQIIGLSRQWLSDEMTGVDYNNAMNALSAGRCYPNPATTSAWIPVTAGAEEIQIQLFSADGSMIAQKSYSRQSLIKLELDSFRPGVYFFRVVSGKQTSELQKLVIVR